MKKNSLALQLALCFVLSAGTASVIKDIYPSQKQKAVRTFRAMRRVRRELADIWI